MRAYTLAEMRTRVRRRTDSEHSAFVSDDELNGYISDGYARLIDILTKSGLAYFESTQTITTDGAVEYNLPADYYGTVGVDYKRDAQHWTEVPRLQVQERNRFTETGAEWALGYRIVGTKIRFYPTPAAGREYRHIYVPAPAKLTTDAQTIDGVAGWEKLVELLAARDVLAKEESSTTQVERQILEEIERIEEAAENRELASPHRIVDVDAYRPWPGDWWPRGGL
jgi:hypothetical protein